MKHCKYLHVRELGKPCLILWAPYHYQCQRFSFDKSLGWGHVCKAYFNSFKMGQACVCVCVFNKAFQVINYLFNWLQKYL